MELRKGSAKKHILQKAALVRSGTDAAFLSSSSAISGSFCSP